ncbi:MAG TPA: L,D-transpeptidase family protein [Steroidobacteraceae bacterium]|nr:L,D-transpeptidase family protein [Steroidobacteraceae bacterium]
MKVSPVRIALVGCLALAAGACSLLRPPVRPAPLVAKKVAPAEPLAPLPVQTERFVLTPGQDVVGSLQIVKVRKDETLSDIGRRFNVGLGEMTRANPNVDPWIPKPGTSVVVPTQYVLPDAPHRGIVVNLAAMRLFYFPPHKRGKPQVVITHPVGIGRQGWKTPQGVTHVLWHEKNPVWRVPPSIIAEHRQEGDVLPKVMGPGPDNPLGDYALHLAWPGYLIHGTNKPVSVGMRVSHGCVHLFPEDIAQIFQMVPNGTEVRVVNEPYLFGWTDGHLYMQSAGPLEDDKRPWKKKARRLLVATLTHEQRKDLERDHQKIDWDRVVQLVAAPAGVPIPVSGLDQSIDGSDDAGLAQVVARARLVRNTLPAGSTWDGKTDLPMTDAEFNKLMSGTDQDASDSATSGDEHGAPAPAAAPGAGAAARPAADPDHGATSAPAPAPSGS